MASAKPLKCKFCHRRCANPQGQSAHERNCPKNPNRVTSFTKPGSRQQAVYDALTRLGGEGTVQELPIPDMTREGRVNVLLRFAKADPPIVERVGPARYRLTGHTPSWGSGPTTNGTRARANGKHPTMGRKGEVRHDDIFRALDKLGGTGTVNQIAELTSTPSGTSRRVYQLTKQGVLERVGPNQYRIANSQALEPLDDVELVEARPSIRDIRARIQTDATISHALTALFPSTSPEHWARLIEWVDLTREMIGA